MTGAKQITVEENNRCFSSSLSVSLCLSCSLSPPDTCYTPRASGSLSLPSSNTGPKKKKKKKIKKEPTRLHSGQHGLYSLYTGFDYSVRAFVCPNNVRLQPLSASAKLTTCVYVLTCVPAALSVSSSLTRCPLSLCLSACTCICQSGRGCCE